MALDKRPAKELFEKLVVTKEGKRLGFVKDISFETRSGELIHFVMASPTTYAMGLNLEKVKDGMLVPYTAILAVGDFVVVSEEEMK